MKNTYHFSGVATYHFAISIDADNEDDARRRVEEQVRFDGGDRLEIDIHDCDVEEDTGDAEDGSDDDA